MFDKQAYQRTYKRKPRGVRERQVQRWSAMQRKYGLTMVDVERMFAEQSGRCGGCFTEITLIPGQPHYRHVDHNHALKKGDAGFIRGLLCGHCNKAAGLLGDNPQKCRQLADYLGRIR